MLDNRFTPFHQTQDTDLGRATMVLTADDFAFFVTEHGLDPRLVLDAPPVRAKSRAFANLDGLNHTFPHSRTRSATVVHPFTAHP
jgi:hypothetical protein